MEVGVGNGRFGVLLGKFFQEYFGIEPDKKYLELAKKSIPKDIKIIYKEGRAEKIPIDVKVDIIFYANVWHFITDFDSAIKEIKRLLKNNGIVLILEPSGKTRNWADSRLNKYSNKFDAKLFKKKIYSIKKAEKVLMEQKELVILEKVFVEFLGSNFYLLKLAK